MLPLELTLKIEAQKIKDKRQNKKIKRRIC